MNEFDNLFNDFFSKRPKIGPMNDELKKLMETLQSFKNIANEEELDDKIQSELGEPDEIHEYDQEGLHYKKLIWNTPHGQFFEVFISRLADDFPPVPREKVQPKSLQEQLDAAVEAEDYELAIKLRDQINGTAPKRKGRPKKS